MEFLILTQPAKLLRRKLRLPGGASDFGTADFLFAPDSDYDSILLAVL
jgi:hypothetical protein